ncbi:MAG: Hsp20/alpha crystallin family protein [Planctomycetia bacterium]|nr:Hsp20/alpha crystallin family protein [Planctomycetia bacterium]
MISPQTTLQNDAGRTAARGESRPVQDSQAPLTYQPNVDVCDLGTEVMLVIDMPGGSAASMQVTFEEGVLTVHAPVPHRALPGRQLVQEYGIGDYRRSFRLGDGFDASQIAASYRRGVLTIRVPRLAAVRPRTIEVRSA